MSNKNEININVKITKKHLAIALTAIVATSLIVPYQIFAQSQAPVTPPGREAEEQEPVNAPKLTVTPLAALTNVLAMPSNNAVLEESYYVISFTTATTGTIKTVEITYPSGFNVANAKLIEVTPPPGIGVGTLSVSAQTLIYTVTSEVSVAPGTKIMLMIGKIINSNTLSNQVTVTTKNPAGSIIDGPTPSATFSLKRVNSPMIQNNSVASIDITQNQVTSGDIQDFIGAGTGIQTSDIANGAVTALKLALGAITGGVGGVIADGSIQLVDLAFNPFGDVACTGCVHTTDIADGTILSADLSSNSVRSAEIDDNTIQSIDIGTGQVSSEDIMDLFGVASIDIIDGQVTSADIATNGVDFTDIAPDAVRSAHILDGQVGSAEIATDAVGPSELANNVVYYQFISFNFSPNTSATGFVPCASGDRIIGGGFDNIGDNSDVRIFDSAPDTVNNRWYVTAKNENLFVTRQVQVFAICLDVT